MTGQPMARSFPEPGRLVELAYRELDLAAGGNLTDLRVLGDITTLPRPWLPESCPVDTRREVWEWLEAVVDWLNTDYCWDPAGLIPGCWPHHAHLVHELAVLADQRRTAERALTSDLLEEWHRYTLPYFHDRLRGRLRSHCDNGHQPWPAKGRHTRFADGADEREQRFAEDLRCKYAERTVREPEQFALIDLTTGEVTR